MTILGAVVAAFFYLRILVVMYMREPGAAMQDLPPLTSGLRTTLWISADLRVHELQLVAPDTGEVRLTKILKIEDDD